MKNIPIVDAHHHLWDLNNEHTKYSWLMVTEGEAFFGDYAAIRKSYLLEDYIKDAQNQNLIKSVHVQAEHDDDKPINETAWLQSLADNHSSKLPNAIVAFADFSKDNIVEILDGHQEYKNTRGIRQILSFNKEEPKYSHASEDFMKNTTWVENFKNIRNRNLSFDIQIYKHQMQDAADLANKYDDVLFILNHTGEPCYQTEDYIHKVGYSERGTVPIEYYLSEQWCLKMEDIANPAIQAVKKKGYIYVSPNGEKEIIRHAEVIVYQFRDKEATHE